MEDYAATSPRTNASVVKNMRGVLSTRVGQGFSLGELRKAGLTLSVARAAGLMVDVRRKSVHDSNVELLKRQAQEISRSQKTAKRTPAKLEEEEEAVAEEPRRRLSTLSEPLQVEAEE